MLCVSVCLCLRYVSLIFLVCCAVYRVNVQKKESDLILIDRNRYQLATMSLDLPCEAACNTHLASQERIVVFEHLRPGGRPTDLGGRIE